VKSNLLPGLLVLASVVLIGCSTPSHNIAKIRLGMTPEEVSEEMGDPYAVRAAKLYRDGNFQEIWEYIPSIFSVALFADRYDKTYWVVFDGGKVVQWGEPGDLSGASTLTGDALVSEYIDEKRVR
jgi:hypothetical protein